MAQLSNSLLVPHLCLLLLHFAATIFAVDHYSRADFPADFVFGSGTAAPQYEGAAFEDGRTPSIWDTFAHSGRGKGATGDVACDGYHKYKADVGLAVDTGLEALRISISWSRLIPNGRGPLNAKGLNYYNNLINELISNGESCISCKIFLNRMSKERKISHKISTPLRSAARLSTTDLFLESLFLRFSILFTGIQPHVTLSHIDLPQTLEDEYGGWLSRKIVKDFVGFADVCFKEFGDRVLHWTTINEANIATTGGYVEGLIAPGRCSDRSICAEGDGATEPYTVLHNMLLAHSAAANLYKQKYKGTQNGKVGINIYTFGFVPYTNSAEDIMAAQRANDFYVGWVMNPLIFGDYPDIMKKRAQKRIPTFTQHESEQVKGSVDFIGVNHYTTLFIKDDPHERDTQDFFADMAVEYIYIEGNPLVDYKYPLLAWGLKGVLEYLKEAYGNPPIYIQENGQMSQRNGTLNDTSRVDYLQAYIGAVLDAVRNGSNTKGYFQWTFLDCLELLDGYTISFGLYYVDLDDKELTRYPKLSAHWYSNFLKGNSTCPNAITQVGKNMSISLR